MTSRVQTFPLPITTEMAPKARLIVHYVRDDGEIVTDALTFNIDGTFKNKVSKSVKLVMKQNVSLTVKRAKWLWPFLDFIGLF